MAGAKDVEKVEVAVTVVARSGLPEGEGGGR